MPVIPIPNKNVLLSQLSTVLKDWPLYRNFHYRCSERVEQLPYRLNQFCPKCDQNVWFEVANQWGTSDLGLTSKHYKCCNCPVQPYEITYYYSWSVDASGEGEFAKVGQFPALDEAVSANLRKRLDKTDLDFYKKALRLRNHNLGLGAVSYLRRVVENKIHDMMDTLLEVALQYDSAPALEEIENIRASRSFEEKINFTASLLPAHLKPEGRPNPIERLHALYSDGLHNKPEDENVQVFDECKEVFEYVFGQLQIQTEEAKSFVMRLSKLSAKTSSGGA